LHSLVLSKVALHSFIIQTYCYAHLHICLHVALSLYVCFYKIINITYFLNLTSPICFDSPGQSLVAQAIGLSYVLHKKTNLFSFTVGRHVPTAWVEHRDPPDTRLPRHWSPRTHTYPYNDLISAHCGSVITLIGVEERKNILKGLCFTLHQK